MTDTLSPAERSARMSLIRAKNSKPEMIVRRMVYGAGYRYRLHRRDIPGAPDLAFIAKRKVIFVHGCFWHRHSDSKCRLARLPKSRQDFWIKKLEGNRVRDLATQARLRSEGWTFLVIWECELHDLDAMNAKIRAFLGGPHARNRAVRGSRGPRARR